MLGHENQLYNRKFIDSFKRSLTEVLNKENSLNEYTTSGRETGLGPGKTLIQPDKTWDEIAREEAGKSRAFKGKDLANVKYERKNGKVYADGIELTTASTKTSHYRADAPTRAAIATPAPQTDGMRASGKSTATAFDEPSSAAAKPSGKPSTLFNDPPVLGLKGQGPGPTPDADIPATPKQTPGPARRVDFKDPMGFKRIVSKANQIDKFNKDNVNFRGRDNYDAADPYGSEIFRSNVEQRRATRDPRRRDPSGDGRNFKSDPLDF